MVDAMISFIMFPMDVILLIFGIVITYCYMLRTSLNNISYVLHRLKTKQIKPNALIIFALIGMFIFRVDVVGSIII